MISDLLNKKDLLKEDILRLLASEGDDAEALFAASAEVRQKTVGNNVYLRGLIELSNICSKDCLYCGIRKGNKEVDRYTLTDSEVLQAARYAMQQRFGSLVIQTGELQGDSHTQRIENLCNEIKKLSGGKLGITLSCGEQTEDVYKRWFDAGAHRYLLRIETSNRELYAKLHPHDGRHDFEKRLECLHLLRETGYQTGTGVMIGLPFQTPDDLADDLLFMKKLDIDMCGMGPYVEHAATPLFAYRDLLLPPQERFMLSLKMVAILRLLLPDINIAATTAMQTLDPRGREKAIRVGANVLMPNITPGLYREKYKLYDNKPCTAESAADSAESIEELVRLASAVTGFDEWGDSKRFLKRAGK